MTGCPLYKVNFVKTLTRLRSYVNLKAPAPAYERRLIYVATRAHRAPPRKITKALDRRGVTLERRGYDWLLGQSVLPAATYVLTDFERLHSWYLEVLGKVHDRLTAAGLTVLNDPRGWLPRPALIRRLRAEGLSDFRCWLPAHGEMPEVFPCFLRTIASHRGTESAILRTMAEAEAALAASRSRGRPLSDLMFVEFAADQVDGAAAPPEEGHYQKDAAYMVGDRVVRALTVNETGWMAKRGTRNRGRPEDYARELAEMRDYPLTDTVRRVFDVAGLDFGRVDFGWKGGRMQVFEINTNPSIQFFPEHPSADRRKSESLMRANLADAFAALVPAPSDTSDTSEVEIRDLVPGKAWDGVTLNQP